MENRRATIPALRSPEDTDLTTWELPEGAIGRLGQGVLNGVEYSIYGLYLAVATKIGFWIYDTATKAPHALRGTERGMFKVAKFSHDVRWIATGDQDGIVKNMGHTKPCHISRIRMDSLTAPSSSGT